LSSKRAIAIIVAFVAAAIITPPDPITQIILAIPLILLYELSILLAKLVVKKRQQEAIEAAEESQESV
jgi:sec-independent protein translocase protein TatC